MHIMQAYKQIMKEKNLEIQLLPNVMHLTDLWKLVDNFSYIVQDDTSNDKTIAFK